MMKVGVVKETYPGERRVALAPANVPQLAKLGLNVIVESGAGAAAGFPDEAYLQRGAHVTADRTEVFATDLLLMVRALGANPQAGESDVDRLRPGQYVIAMCDPLGAPQAVEDAAGAGATVFALELIPRITRAQSMDVLSSMATIAGYRAVLLAAVELPKMFPLMMTAAGTVAAAKVFVIGAGVAGLQAIATARRLGGVVQAYDVRPATREQIESLGGRFVAMELEAGDAEDRGGYAKAMDEDFYRRQRELMARVAAESDVIITTAAIPGKPSPRLITESAVAGMAPGSVIIDLAAERGGNCELTRADERVVAHGVTILGPTNLPSEAPHDSSLMYANNVVRFVQNLVKDGQVALNFDDEVIRDTCLTHDGQVRSARVRELLGVEASPPTDPSAEETQPDAQP
jgi:H+-translocating NAD(P) transhydrogenase subunit alpha